MAPRAADGPLPGATTAYAEAGAAARSAPPSQGAPIARWAPAALSGRTGRRTRAAGAGVLACAGAGGGAATAQPVDPPTGGIAPVAAPDADPLLAADYGAPAPRIARVACVRACSTGGAARPGALVRVSGRRLRVVREVRFLAGPGGADDTSVAPERTRGRAVVARVPRTAVTGLVTVARTDGTRSVPSRAPLVIDAAVPVPPPGAVDAEVQDSKVYFGGQRAAELSYVVGGTEPVAVSVELVRAADGEVVERWTEPDVAPGIPRTVRWDGTSGGRVHREGVYRFRVSAVLPGAAALASASAGPAAAAEDAPGRSADVAPDAPGDSGDATGSTAAGGDAAQGGFTFLRHRFPILGAHEYGEGGAHFGGGRGHQGEDVFAACGTPVVAARAGRVAFKQFEGRAGHYVVIDGARTGVDYAYMHLRDAALVEAGQRVRTGQLIGYVGQTGRASTCHLHFEMWSAPGWYRGGAPFDPLRQLQAWDEQS